MHLFRDIKSVYRFITFKKNWWARKFNNISFLKHSKPYYIVCYLHVTPKTRLNAWNQHGFFFNSKDTIYLVVTWTRILMFIKWHIDNLVIYLHEKYNNSKPYSYRQNVVTISSECEFFRVRLYALAIWGKLRCSGNAKTKEKVDIKQLTWHNSDEAMLGAFKINYTVQLI